MKQPEVKIGQVWKDKDPRSKERYLLVVNLKEKERFGLYALYASCCVVEGMERARRMQAIFLENLPADRPETICRRVKSRVDRFSGSSHGYEIALDVAQ